MATYIPNATQTTEPVESRTVESAALEFRTLKSSITARIEDVQDGLDTEIVNRIAGDANLQAQNNAQDVRLTAIENALPFIGEGGLPGTVYVQRLSGTGAQTVFTLNTAPQSNNVVDIYINGLYQNKDTFTVSGADVTFSDAPPAGTNNIEVQVTVTIALGETDASLVTYGAATVADQLDAISTAGGSSLVGFQQAGTGAVATTVQAKLRETVSVKDFGAVGDGVTDDTTAIQNAVNAASEVRFTPGKTYIVSPQTLSSLGGGVGICINVSSNRRLVIYGATIKQKDGTGGSGAVIGNTAAVQNVLIEGGTVDGNRANTSNTMGGIVFYNATNCEIRKVLVKGSRQIGAGFRSTTTGFGKNAVRDCIIEDSGYIGIQCNRQDLGVEISGNIVDFSVDNAIDVEGNNTSGDPGFGSRIVITNNRCSNFTTGIFLESIGNAIVSNNYLDNFNVHGIILNRINSGALNVIVANNQITNGAGRSGVLVNNNSGNVIIDGNFFKTLAHSIECNGAALGLSVGKNLHVDISQTLIKVPQGTNQLIHSRIGSQDYRDARVVGKPFTISPLSNTNNFPARAFNTVCAPTCYMEDGVIASTVEDEYKDGITGTLDLNGNWGAYSIYSSFYNPTGETLVTETASSLVVGRYVTINGTLFKVSAARTGTEFALQSAAGVDGDYTATTNGAYAWVEYYPEWQTT